MNHGYFLMGQILIKCSQGCVSRTPSLKEIPKFKKQNGELDSVGYCTLCNFCLSVP